MSIRLEKAAALITTSVLLSTWLPLDNSFSAEHEKTPEPIGTLYQLAPVFQLAEAAVIGIVGRGSDQDLERDLYHIYYYLHAFLEDNIVDDDHPLYQIQGVVWVYCEEVRPLIQSQKLDSMVQILFDVHLPEDAKGILVQRLRNEGRSGDWLLWAPP